MWYDKIKNDLEQLNDWEGTALRGCWHDVAICTVISFVMNVIVEAAGESSLDWFAPEMHSFLQLPVAFLLVFRTNFAVQRYFEGRNHVGKMVHSVRELARDVETYVDIEEDKTKRDKADIARLLKAYLIAVRLSIRKIEGAKMEELKFILTKEEYGKVQSVKKNFPVLIVAWIGDVIIRFKGKLLFDRAMDFMEDRTSCLMESWMGMQKLATTPMPFPYIQMLYALLYIYAYTYPIVLAHQYKWVSLPVTVLISLAVFGINQIGKELEDPFGTEFNDISFEFFEGASNAACKAMLPPIVLPEHDENKLRGSTPLGGVPLNNSTVQLEAFLNSASVGVDSMNEFKASQGPEDLSSGLQAMLSAYFDRYDTAPSNGLIDTEKERMQLVTNTAFSLKMTKELPFLLAQVEEVGSNTSWTKERWCQWFWEKVRAAAPYAHTGEGR